MHRIPSALAVMLALLLAPLQVRSAEVSTASNIPKVLKSAIDQYYPGTTIIDRQDLSEECRLEKVDVKFPGLVSADFNGDRIPDYSVVLKHMKPRRHPSWGTIHDYRVVAFLGTPNGQFKAFPLWEYESDDKSAWYMIEHRQKALADSATGMTIPLKFPAIGLIRCGGGSAGYYWNGNGFSLAGGT
jgi:hypothetical protein